MNVSDIKYVVYELYADGTYLWTPYTKFREASTYFFKLVNQYSKPSSLVQAIIYKGLIAGDIYEMYVNEEIGVTLKYHDWIKEEKDESK